MTQERCGDSSKVGKERLSWGVRDLGDCWRGRQSEPLEAKRNGNLGSSVSGFLRVRSASHSEKTEGRRKEWNGAVLMVFRVQYS